MNAGRELDALIAEKVMGRAFDAEFHRECAEDNLETELRNYSTDIAAAWEVVEKLRSEGCRYSITDCPHEKRPTVQLTLKTGAACGAYAPTVPHAICLAALKALEP